MAAILNARMAALAVAAIVALSVWSCKPEKRKTGPGSGPAEVSPKRGMAMIKRVAGKAMAGPGTSLSPARKGQWLLAGSTVRTGGETRVMLRARPNLRMALGRSTNALLEGSAASFDRPPVLTRVTLKHGLLYLTVPEMEAGPEIVVGPYRVGPWKKGTGVGVELLVTYGGPVIQVMVARGTAVVTGPEEKNNLASGEAILFRKDMEPVRRVAESYFEDTEWVRSLEALSPAAIGTVHPKENARSKVARPAEVSVELDVRGLTAQTRVTHVFPASAVSSNRSVFSFPRPPDAVVYRVVGGPPDGLKQARLIRRRRAGGPTGGAGGKPTLTPSARARWQSDPPLMIPLGPTKPGKDYVVVVEYAQVLPAQRELRRYTFPLGLAPGTPPMGRFCFRYRFHGEEPSVSSPYYRFDEEEGKEGRVGKFCRKTFTPHSDLQLKWEPAGSAKAMVQTWKDPKGRLLAAVAARITKEPKKAARPAKGPPGTAPARRLLLIVDGSRSLLLNRSLAVQTVAALIARLSPRDRFQVAVLGPRPTTLSPSPLPATRANAHKAALFVRKQTFDGTTDLAAGLAWAGKLWGRKGGQAVYIGDGVATVGAMDAETVAKAARRAFADTRLDAIGVGRGRDGLALAALARAGGGTAFLPTSAAELRQAVSRIAGAPWRAALQDVRLQAPGSRGLYPSAFGTVFVRDEVVAMIRLPSGQKLGGRVQLSWLAGPGRGGRTLKPGSTTGNMSLAMLWARRHLNRKAAGRAKVRGLAAESRRLGVMTRMTVFSLRGGRKAYWTTPRALAGSTPGTERVWAHLASLALPLRPHGGGTLMDSDRDKIPDVDDECPHEPETYNGFDDDDGCPDTGRIIVKAKAITILDKIFFESRKATIRKQSFGLLDAIASTIKGHPSIRLVEIAGHTDERRTPGISNKKLSQQRAEAVRTALTERGVEPQRLIARGYGASNPLDPEHNEKAWAKNRRVEFVIRKRHGAVEAVRRRASVFKLAPTPPAPEPAPTARAIQAARKAARATPTRKARLRLVRLLTAAGRLNDAARAALAWRALDPLNLAVHRMAADLMLASKQRSAAVLAFSNILELAPRQPEAFRLLSAVLTETSGRTKKAPALPALRYLEKAHAMRPKDPCYALELAGLNLTAGKPARALKLIETLALQNRKDMPLVSGQAVHLLKRIAKKKRGLSRRAKRLIKQLAKLYPERADISVRTGWSPLTGHLRLRLITPSGERISPTRPWGLKGERFRTACNAVSRIRVPKASVGEYRVELAKPEESGAWPLATSIVVTFKAGTRKAKTTRIPFTLLQAGKPVMLARIKGR